MSFAFVARAQQNGPPDRLRPGGQEGIYGAPCVHRTDHDRGREYDPAIAFFVDALGFDLVEDSAALTNDGRPKRWVVVRPPSAKTGILLARADGDHQRAFVGDQAAGRVGFFLRVDDFDATYARLTSAGVPFVTSPRDEPHGPFAVFLDVAGNRWDLLGPASARAR